MNKVLVIVLSLILVTSMASVAACSSGNPATTPATTTQAPTTTNGPADPPPITSHPGGPGYDNLCMICHAIGGTDPVPADHADYSPGDCYDCHKVG